MFLHSEIWQNYCNLTARQLFRLLKNMQDGHRMWNSSPVHVQKLPIIARFHFNILFKLYHQSVLPGHNNYSDDYMRYYRLFTSHCHYLCIVLLIDWVQNIYSNHKSTHFQWFCSVNVHWAVDHCWGRPLWAMDTTSLSTPVGYRNEVVVLKEGYAFATENGWYTDVFIWV